MPPEEEEMNPDIRYVCYVLKDCFSPFKDWKLREIALLVAWYKGWGYLMKSGDTFAMFRILKDVEDNKEDYKHDPDGKVVWVDYLYKNKPEEMGSIFMAALRKWGDKPILGFQRRGRTVVTNHKLGLKFVRLVCH